MSHYSLKQFLTEHTDYLTEYSEIHHLIIEILIDLRNDESATEALQTGIFESRQSSGTGVFWELCQEWAIEFCLLHEHTEWDGEFYDEIEAFVNKKIEAL